MNISSSISIWNNNFSVFAGGGGSYLVDDYSPQDYFSVRLGSSTYSGALVRIRRDSDNAEKDFYPDTSEELSMSSEDGAGTSLTTWIGANSGFITTWYNQVSGGGDVTQATAGNQPRVVNTGSLETKGGKPSIYFQGTNDSLQKSISNLPEPFSVFGVASNESSGSLGTISSTRSGAGQEGYSMFLDRGTNKVLSLIDEGATAPQLNYPSQINTNSQRLLTTILDSSLNGEAWYNGTSQATHTYGSTISGINNFSIGSQAFNASYLIGHIQEVIIFNTDQTSNRADIETNINDYYSIY